MKESDAACYLLVDHTNLSKDWRKYVAWDLHPLIWVDGTEENYHGFL
jgi:hypothetical protein